MMNELTILLNQPGHKELKDYLMGLPGILDVHIQNEEYLEIYIKFDSNLITPKILKTEVRLFLDTFFQPSMVAFDKHSKSPTLKYDIVISHLCCEYCFYGMIEDLFDRNGIEKVFSDWCLDAEKENVILHVFYNPEDVTDEDLKILEVQFNS